MPRSSTGDLVPGRAGGGSDGSSATLGDVVKGKGSVPSDSLRGRSEEAPPTPPSSR